MRRCRTCGETKPIEDFYMWPSGAMKSDCRPCDKKRRRQRYEDGGIDRSYAQVLRERYSLTLDEYNAIAARQGNLCALCGLPERALVAGKPRRLAVDHDHTTGVIRELLCARCNTLVAAVETDPSLVAAAVVYLERHRAPRVNVD